MSTNTPARLILVRHGRTTLNAEDRLRGRADPDLEPVGLVQAQASAQALRQHQIRHVISSPLQRAVATAHIIADASGTDVTIDPAFIDRDYGPWTGHVKADVINQFGAIDLAFRTSAE